jgi:hypothetical protein
MHLRLESKINKLEKKVSNRSTVYSDKLNPDFQFRQIGMAMGFRTS